MKIGILKESGPENRVALIPEGVKVLKGLKLEVLVEKKAGEKAFFADNQYTEAGAAIVSRDELLKQADILLKINPPEIEEIKNIN